MKQIYRTLHHPDGVSILSDYEIKGYSHNEN